MNASSICPETAALRKVLKLHIPHMFWRGEVYREEAFKQIAEAFKLWLQVKALHLLRRK